MTENKTDDKNFANKIWKAAGIIALLVLVIWIIKVTFNVLLLVLAGALIAIFFRGLADLIKRKLKLSPALSLTLSILSTIIFITAFFWFTGSRVAAQIDQLRETLPAALENFENKLRDTEIGERALDKLTSDETKGKLYSMAQTFFRSTFGVVGDIYVVILLGVFFTATPKIYTDGIIKLIPSKHKAEGKKVLNKVGFTLAKWLKGQLFAMLVVMVLTSIGLLILNMPMAFALAMIAGVLNFIPNFGPLIALIPAVLVAFMQDTTTGYLVIGLYIFVQVMESSVITPQIQKKLIDLPPALIIIAQLLMGVLTGGWGLLLAMPLVAMMIVLVQELYIKKQKEI